MSTSGTDAGGTLTGELRSGGEEAEGEASSFGVGGAEVAGVGGFLSSGVEGTEQMGGDTGFSEGGGEVGRGGAGSCFVGGEGIDGGASSGKERDVGRGGAGDSGGGGEAGGGGAGSSGGGGEEGRGGATSFGTGGFSEGCSLKQIQVSLISSPAGGACSGPKMLSKSAMDDFWAEPSASVSASATEETTDQRLSLQRGSLVNHFTNRIQNTFKFWVKLRKLKVNVHILLYRKFFFLSKLIKCGEKSNMETSHQYYLQGDFQSLEGRMGLSWVEAGEELK